MSIQFEPRNWSRIERPNRFAQASGHQIAWAYPTREGVEVDTLVNHSAEIALDAIGDDSGAWDIDTYMGTVGSRRVSWHCTSDSDSNVWALPWSHTGFHAGSGWNRRSWGLEQAFRANHLHRAPAAWVEGLVECSAAAFAAACTYYELPAEHVTPGQRGIVAHGTPHGAPKAGISPGRIRTDPGPYYPWDDLIGRTGELVDQGVVALGFTGELVGECQRFLIAQGYDLSVDDDFGPFTLGALHHWHKSRGHRATGVWTDRTPVSLPPLPPQPIPQPEPEPEPEPPVVEPEPEPEPVDEVVVELEARVAELELTVTAHEQTLRTITTDARTIATNAQAIIEAAAQ
jgi:hypothetical protein